MKKRRILLSLPALALLLCSGCYGVFGGSGNRPLTDYLGKSPIVSARYFETRDRETYAAQELPEEQFESLLNDLQGIRVRRFLAHTDYFWGGTYGLELTLEDGTYFSYDGTRLTHRAASYLDDPDAKELGSDYLQVTEGDFWEIMDRYFTDVLPLRYGGRN